MCDPLLKCRKLIKVWFIYWYISYFINKWLFWHFMLIIHVFAVLIRCFSYFCMQTIKDQANQIDELSGENLQQRSRVVELERVMGSSDSDKDSEISRLRRQVQEMKESSRTREVLCTSLAEETHNLRQQLHDVAVHCQQMALKLEQSNKDSAKNSLKSDYHTAKVQCQAMVVIVESQQWLTCSHLEPFASFSHYKPYSSKRKLFLCNSEIFARSILSSFVTKNSLFT